MKILGISCFYHDSAAALLIDGKLIAAAEEERFNRIKNTAEFPIEAINFCMQKGNITINDLDYIVFYEKPYLKFSRIIKDHTKNWPFTYISFLKAIPFWLQDRLYFPIVLKKQLGYEGKIIYTKHQMSHAASAFLVSPFKEAAIITSDGVGEDSTLSIGFGKENDIQILKEIMYPNSLGLLYSAFTSYLGFKVNREEGTVMGLSSYGKPEYKKEFEKFITIFEDGSFYLNQKYFGYNRGNSLFSKKLEKLLGKRRQPNEKITQKHKDIASTLQYFIEEIILKIAKEVKQITNQKKLCLAGGVFLNCVANQKLLDSKLFENIFIQPAAGDSGGAIGAAFYVYNSILENKRNYVLDEVFLGPDYSDRQIEIALENASLKYKKLSDSNLSKDIAKEVLNNKVIGWFQGRMEFGPRALGNRSILANPKNPKIRDILNKKVKNREIFRPFAPSILEEHSYEYFGIEKSPFMLLAPIINPKYEKDVPAIVHIDKTCRIQTINKKHKKYYDLIAEFYKISDVPMILNTSFNKKEPIICSVDDAINTFNNTNIDILVIGNYIVKRL